MTLCKYHSNPIVPNPICIATCNYLLIYTSHNVLFLEMIVSNKNSQNRNAITKTFSQTPKKKTSLVINNNRLVMK